MGDKGDGCTDGLAAFLVNTHNLRDNFSSLFHIEHVTLVNIQLGNDIGIVQRGALDDGAAQQHGVEIGNRGDDTRAAHFKRHILEFGAFTFRGKLEGNGPTGRFSRGS